MASIDIGKEKSKPSDWTNKIPMVDLDTVVKAVKDIHDKALETAAMPAVAKALGYSGPSSSPFYRRVVAARLFGLLSQGATLTQAARDYIRPDDVGTKSSVLLRAIRGIPQYVELLNRYSGKKINVGLVANAIAKDCKLTDACALICAKAFEASIIFAGMLASDGSVQPLPAAAVEKAHIPAGNGDCPPTPESASTPPLKRVDVPGTQEHMIFLDKEKSRSFAFTGPLEITRAEFERICKWLEFTLLIVDQSKGSQA